MQTPFDNMDMTYHRIINIDTTSKATPSPLVLIDNHQNHAMILMESHTCDLEGSGMSSDSVGDRQHHHKCCLIKLKQGMKQREDYDPNIEES